MNDKMEDVRNERLVKEQKVGPIFEKGIQNTRSIRTQI